MVAPTPITTAETPSDDTDRYAVDQDLIAEHLVVTTQVSQPLNRRKRQANFLTTNSVDNYPYTMEVLVAADRKMQEYHGSDLQAYILTLMSIVSNIFADASIGNSINVAVVHILLLKDDLHVESNNVGTYSKHIVFWNIPEIYCQSGDILLLCDIWNSTFRAMRQENKRQIRITHSRYIQTRQ